MPTFNEAQLKHLQAPLSSGHVKEREQGGKKLSYIEAWHAIAEANRIFGFDAWTRETVLLQETNRELVDLRGNSGPYQQWRVGYLAKVRITVGAIVREGTGFGSGMARPEALGDAIESAAKEAESDAMKRALMTFGNPFGLALYDKTQANVANPAARKSAAQAKRDGDHEKIAREIAECDLNGLRGWFENFDTLTSHLPISWLDAIRDKLEARREELMKPAEITEAEAELDEGFRSAVGPGEPVSSRMAGAGSPVAA